MANATKKCLFLILSVTPAWGGAPATSTGVSQRRPPASPSLPQGSPSGRRTRTQPAPRPPSPLRTAPHPGILRGWGHLASPQTHSHLITSLLWRKPVPSLVESPGATLSRRRGGTNLPPPDLLSDAHSPSCSASPTQPGSAPAQARCRRRWRGRVALWPRGPVAGHRRQARPLLPRVPRGPPQPRLRWLLRPRLPAAAAAQATARCSHVT